MSDDNSKSSYPKKKIRDYILPALKPAIAFFPLGGTVNELLSSLIQPQLDKRKDEWCEYIGEALKNAIERIGKLEDITSNENFVDVAIQASRIALTTSAAEKREALKNAIINSLSTLSLDQFKQRTFISLLDQFNEFHILFLKILDNPNITGKTISFREPNGSYLLNPSFKQFIFKAYPELNKHGEFCSLIINDLFNKNLICVKDLLFPVIENDKNIFSCVKILTDLGSDFLHFISEQKQ
ncbi:MAG: hypothetical protein LBS60_14710 [Deltaproteobacteria bacterium]|jgi:hypothetical protein|nr:hypothetical protein [Deltaproteobacteria bacterium]